MEVSPTTTMTGDMKERSEKLAKAFQEKFSSKPEFIVRVPGRVNLIGEHIDYCGYGVHPMAIEQDILLAVEGAPETIHLANVNPLYPEFKLENLKNLEISTDQILWWSYFLCGVKGVYEDLLAANQPPRGLRVLADGQIPPSAGLSSSSAVVVSAALATAAVNHVKTGKEELAGLCARAERYIGTQGGGMDQAIEILAEQGKAKLIEFNPLRSDDVTLPTGAVFVVANSLEEKNKAASNEFNTRVVECRIAAKILAKSLLIESKWQEITKLKDVQTMSGKEVGDMVGLVESILHQQIYSRAEILDLLDIPDSFLRSDILTPNTQELKEFKLKQRARHVFSEAARVYQFRDACQTGGDDCVSRLGELMTASHTSCRQDYECSAAGLDSLVEKSLSLGALGARLTGAGWGGCIVAIVPADKAATFLPGLKAAYYDRLSTAAPAQAAFVTRPSGGARVWSWGEQ